MNSPIHQRLWTVRGAAVCISTILIFSVCGCEFSGFVFTFRGETTTISQQGVVNADITQVVISNQYGDVNIARADGDPSWTWDLKVWADTKPQADQFLKELVMDVQIADGKQTWTLLMPPSSSGLNGVQSNLTLRVSEDTIVKLENAHGNVRVANLSSDVEIDNRHGNVVLNGLAGNLKVGTAHGDLKAASIGQGQLSVQHGSAAITSVAGSLSIESAHGRVNVGQAVGPLTVEGSHSSIKVDGVEENVNLSTRHGSIDAVGLRGNVVTDNEHGDTSVATAGKTVSSTSRHGKVEVTITNPDFKSVTVTNAHNDINVVLPDSSVPAISMQVEHGDTKSEFDGDPTSAQQINLNNWHGNIRIKKSNVAAEAELVP